MAFIKKKAFLKNLLSYSKVREFYLPQHRWPFLVPTPLIMSRILSVTCFLMQKALRIRMYFSVSYVIILIFIIVYSTCPRVRLFVVFCHHAHLDPKVCTLRSEASEGFACLDRMPLTTDSRATKYGHQRNPRNVDMILL